MPKMVNLIGLRFGRLTVMEKTHIKNRVHWVCNCECGSTVSVLTDSLKSGKTKSCGCLHREKVRELATTHGRYYEPLHGVWNSMLQRCGNPKSKDYKYYGARGISVCSEWRSYIFFRNWALSAGYEQGLTIDRIDNDGNYEPVNCHWIPLEKQMNNRRNTKGVALHDEL